MSSKHYIADNKEIKSIDFDNMQVLMLWGGNGSIDRERQRWGFSWWLFTGRSIVLMSRIG